MRLWVVAGVALVAAALGAGAALVVAHEADDGATTTISPVVAPPPASVPTRNAPPSAFDPAALYAARADGVVTIYANLGADGSSQGSGFVVDGDGLVLTNAHVITNVTDARSGAVRGASAVYVEFSDGDRVSADIVGWDLFSDVGVVRVAASDHALSPVPLGNSSNVLVGQPVAAIGSPFGQQTSLSVGVVSATGRSIDSLTSGFAVANAIQVDAPINRGSSGGPLFDASGRVIGINAQIESSSGTAEGVGFAIPINVARRSLDQLVRTGKVRYAYIGVRTQDVTPGLAREFGLGAPRGALVTRVDDGTPAATAGLHGGTRTEVYNGLDVTLGGDLIVAIGKTPVTSTEDVSRIVATELLPGETVTFTVLRGGTRRAQVDVTLGQRPSGTR
jgi:S1-C subfamily serine protease